MTKSSVDKTPIVALRFNSIKIDHKQTTSAANSQKGMIIPTCAIRVDIYNGLLKILFESYLIN
jgi:hypothetical protein